MIKNYKILLWVLFVAISIVLIAPNPNPGGVLIDHVGKNSTTTLENGDIIYKINDIEASPDTIKNLYFGTVKFETNHGTKFARVNGSLDINGGKVPSTNIKLGLDLKGGVRATIKPNSTDNATIEQIRSVLESRINFYGLRESVFRTIYHQGQGFIEISMAGGSGEELKELLEAQGNFEAKIPVKIKTANNAGEIKLDRTYEINVINNRIEADGKSAGMGEIIKIGGVDFFVSDIANRTINLTSLVFSGNDIKTVFYDPQRSRIENNGNGFSWSFGVLLSQEGAERFSHITQNLGIVPGGYLESKIYLYLDNQLIDSLNIASGLRGRVETEIQVTGGAPTMDQAISERSKLQSILRSGALPTTIKIIQMDSVSPSLGSEFLRGAFFAAMAAIIGVGSVVFIRYRKIKLVIPMLIVSLTEVIIILGISTIINWTIDLAAIAGIIASIGTGIDSQIIILDQALRGKDVIDTMKEKMKRAFFMIFGAGGTLIAAMLPLMFGFGILRGFAIITIIGVLVGILVTRPAFGVIVEKIVDE